MSLRFKPPRAIRIDPSDSTRIINKTMKEICIPTMGLYEFQTSCYPIEKPINHIVTMLADASLARHIISYHIASNIGKKTRQEEENNSMTTVMTEVSLTVCPFPSGSSPYTQGKPITRSADIKCYLGNGIIFPISPVSITIPTPGTDSSRHKERSNSGKVLTREGETG